MVEQQTFQIIVLIVQGVFAVGTIFLGFILKSTDRNQREMGKSLREVSTNLQALNNLVLAHYVTKGEVQGLREYVRDNIHDFRTEVHHHEVCIHLLAKHTNMDLPSKPSHGHR